MVWENPVETLPIIAKATKTKRRSSVANGEDTTQVYRIVVVRLAPVFVLHFELNQPNGCSFTLPAQKRC